MIAYFDDFAAITDDISEQMMSDLPPVFRRKVEQSKTKAAKVQRMVSFLLLRYCIMKEYPGSMIGEFSYGKYGKPYIENAEFHFNYSHTKSAAACAVSAYPIGIDVQDIVTDYQKAVRKACTDREKYVLESAQDPEREFTKLWTLKEAYVKQKGTGIWDSIWRMDFSYHMKDFWKQENRYFHIIEESNYMLTFCSEKSEKLVEKICIKNFL